MSSSRFCYRIVSFLEELGSVDVKSSLRVLSHTRSALGVNPSPREEWKRNSICYASLLYNVDSPKNRRKDNTCLALDSILPGEKNIHDLVIKMISIPDDFSVNDIEEEWMLIPKLSYYADCTGETGVLRAWMDVKRVGKPFFLPTTPRGKTKEDIEEILTRKRRARYLKSGRSLTMIDHYYDHLLYINSKTIRISNSYLKEHIHEGRDYLIKFLLIFGNSGKISDNYFQSLLKKYDYDVKTEGHSFNKTR